MMTGVECWTLWRKLPRRYRLTLKEFTFGGVSHTSVRRKHEVDNGSVESGNSSYATWVGRSLPSSAVTILNDTSLLETRSLTDSCFTANDTVNTSSDCETLSNLHSGRRQTKIAFPSLQKTKSLTALPSVSFRGNDVILTSSYSGDLKTTHVNAHANKSNCRATLLCEPEDTVVADEIENRKLSFFKDNLDQSKRIRKSISFTTNYIKTVHDTVLYRPNSFLFLRPTCEGNVASTNKTSLPKDAKYNSLIRDNRYILSPKDETDTFITKIKYNRNIISEENTVPINKNETYVRSKSQSVIPHGLYATNSKTHAENKFRREKSAPFLHDYMERRKLSEKKVIFPGLTSVRATLYQRKSIILINNETSENIGNETGNENNNTIFQIGTGDEFAVARYDHPESNIENTSTEDIAPCNPPVVICDVPNNQVLHRLPSTE